jgi:peptidyl-prolyl cis-trans isomerase SurA
MKSMKHNSIFTALCLITVISSATALFAGVNEAEPLEKIVARVGAYPILVSELATQVQMIAMQNGFQPKTERELQEFQETVLKQLVNEKLFLIAAQQDTTMNVTPDEVNEQLDQQVSQISSRFATEEEFLDALAEEGLTLRELRRKFYQEVENRLLKDRFIQRKLSGISVTRQEVGEFYELYKDSIPDQPAAVRIAHVLISYASSSETLDSIRTLASTVRQRAAAGESFDELAASYSAPPGGDLGYLRRSDVAKEFGDAAFNLKPGGISGLVQTQVGLHILKVSDRSGDSARISQIYFPVSATANDSAAVLSRADSLKSEIESGALTFAEAAKEHSTDNDTRRTEGELGWYAYQELPEEFAGFVTPDLEVDNIVGPVKSQYGVHIIRVLEKVEEQTITLEDSYDQIRELARRRKTDQKIDEWIELQKERTYVEIRPIFQR